MKLAIVRGTCVSMVLVGCSAPLQETEDIPAASVEAEDLAQQWEGAPAGTVKAQIASGADVFDDHCDFCHGQRGQGKAGIIGAPQVLGPGVLATAGGKRDFMTARQLYDFVVTEMPALNPGSLSAAEYWDVVAYMIHENGVDLRQRVEPGNATEVRLTAVPVAARQPPSAARGGLMDR